VKIEESPTRSRPNASPAQKETPIVACGNAQTRPRYGLQLCTPDLVYLRHFVVFEGFAAFRLVQNSVCYAYVSGRIDEEPDTTRAAHSPSSDEQEKYKRKRGEANYIKYRCNSRAPLVWSYCKTQPVVTHGGALAVNSITSFATLHHTPCPIRHGNG
jgi:hypothetical protein